MKLHWIPARHHPSSINSPLTDNKINNMNPLRTWDWSETAKVNESLHLTHLTTAFPALSLPGVSLHLKPRLPRWLHSPTTWRPASLPSWSWGCPKHLEHTDKTIERHLTQNTTEMRRQIKWGSSCVNRRWYLQSCSGRKLAVAAVVTAGCPGGSAGPPILHCCSEIFGQCKIGE